MKVLHVLYSNQYSGAENVVCQIINMFREDREIEMVYCSRDGQIREALLEKNITFVPIEDLTVRELKRVLKEQKPDLIHAHDFRASVIAALAVNGKRIRIISHLHNNPPWIQSVNKQSLLYLISSFFFEKILLVSDAIGKEYVFNRFLMQKEIIIGNPVNITEIKAIDDTVPVSDLIFVGRLSAPKNPKRFLTIVSALQKRNPSLRVLVLGDGELRKECEEFIETHGLQKTVKLLGFRKNPYDYMAKSKILCMTSDWEGFGLVAVEALALGKPVVCTSVGGLVGIVEESCGCLCDTDTAFIHELGKLLENKSYYEMKALGARKKAEILHNSTKYKKRLLHLYETKDNILKKEDINGTK